MPSSELVKYRTKTLKQITKTIYAPQDLPSSTTTVTQKGCPGGSYTYGVDNQPVPSSGRPCPTCNAQATHYAVQPNQYNQQQYGVQQQQYAVPQYGVQDQYAGQAYTGGLTGTGAGVPFGNPTDPQLAVSNQFAPQAPFQNQVLGQGVAGAFPNANSFVNNQGRPCFPPPGLPTNGTGNGTICLTGQPVQNGGFTLGTPPWLPIVYAGGSFTLPDTTAGVFDPQNATIESAHFEIDTATTTNLLTLSQPITFNPNTSYVLVVFAGFDQNVGQLIALGGTVANPITPILTAIGLNLAPGAPLAAQAGCQIATAINNHTQIFDLATLAALPGNLLNVNVAVPPVNGTTTFNRLTSYFTSGPNETSGDLTIAVSCPGLNTQIGGGLLGALTGPGGLLANLNLNTLPVIGTLLPKVKRQLPGLGGLGTAVGGLLGGLGLGGVGTTVGGAVGTATSLLPAPITALVNNGLGDGLAGLLNTVIATGTPVLNALGQAVAAPLGTLLGGLNITQIDIFVDQISLDYPNAHADTTLPSPCVGCP